MIVCVYNTKKSYLEECIKSLVRSTVSGDAEILIIDDGSDTDYGDIIKKYPVKYLKTENRGQLGARLCGIYAARGDFVAFVDSDDTVSMNYHLPMLDEAEKQNADIVIGGWAFRTEGSKRVCTKDTAMAKRLCAEGDGTLLLYTSQRGREHSYYVLWNKIYRRKLMEKCLSALTELGLAEIRLTYSEDVLMNFFSFKLAKKVINLNSGFYFYRIHESQSVAVRSRGALRRHIDSFCMVMYIINNNIGNNIYASAIRQNLAEWSRLMARSHYTAARSMREPNLYEYIKARYGTKRNEASTLADGAVYTSAELLGENFDEIDSALTAVYAARRPATASYERRAKCISRIISDMPHKITFSRSGEFSIPKRRIRSKDRLLHNAFFYKLGTVLFKKGSKARAFLKKIL